MQEYLGIKVVHAEKNRRLRESLDGRRVGQDGYRVVYDKGTGSQYVSWSPADKFEESYVAVETGTGAALKAVAAMAILGAMQGSPLPDPANEQPSNAEMGVITEEHLRGCARLCHNVVREFLAYENLLHRPPFDACPLSFQHEIVNRVSDIVHERPYRIDMSNKVEALKDRFYRVIIRSILS